MAKGIGKKKTAGKPEAGGKIIIDEAKGLVFASEEELYQHFLPQIEALEKDYVRYRPADDITDEEFPKYEEYLGRLLDAPDEIWEDAEAFKGEPIYIYIARFVPEEGQSLDAFYYVAVTYMANDTPTFVYLHFPSHDLGLVDRFRRGEIVYDRIAKEVEQGAVEGDALSEGDELAVGLYKAMLKLRGEKDIPEEEFKKFENFREQSIEEADEIWRTTDLSGNVLVSFIRDCSDQGENGLHYIVVTIEDLASSSHALLFSFPTRDSSLVDRYRHGENLQAEEVVQEASH